MDRIMSASIAEPEEEASKSRGVTTYAESEEKEPVRAEELQQSTRFKERLRKR
ncbi:uncharacterized protein CYBJADRAFT_169767 [Cyberlindnera jadinii NRRL Y-1542]|uniref:Uncharacterized protein n=1 Tax=Cyberlindnera jadinii (strain ATCC 18201 / CBS 1600 / BCRC 20928 / JCM 3617 / NBRC 0987 / NRRL Y-1542) TaxID=983966 RepID=A0A1E4RUS0_CYBJN|nr:hypothetical protein CYBJADRAFT_169767 [Cyberlindnera jadinii NRRL Y-1542]ODV71019.1 hypothetical protein CYBJADRAFT_169767 [Cyberlindnera jadinii NRRL Y-1542]